MKDWDYKFDPPEPEAPVCEVCEKFEAIDQIWLDIPHEPGMVQHTWVCHLCILPYEKAI